MTAASFALWKFQTIEGILKNCHPSDFLSTVFTKGYSTYIVHYDYHKCVCEIEDPLNFDNKPIACAFQDLPRKLREMGLYEKRNLEDCNINALMPFEGKID